MKSTNRLAAPAAGFFALSLIAAPLMAQGGGGLGQQQAQRGGPPNSDTPYILITTFHSDDRKLGVDLAEDLRKRVSQEHSARELFVIQKKAIDGTLEASGYRPDSALSSSDLMELAKQLRGEIVIDGTVNKAGNALKIDSRILMKSGQATLAQPLPVTEAKDVGDASKQIEKAISDAQKALAPFKTCKNNMTAAKYPEAATAARAGLTAYPNSAFNRVCLLQSLVAQKASPDQIIEVANAIKTQDPHSAIAYANLSDAYMAKGDTTHAMEALLGLYREDPTNKGLATSIVGILANSGAPDQALPIIDSLLVNDPADPGMLRQKWLLLLRANRFKEAMAAGEAYVKVDTAAATLDYYQRQIGTAQKDSNAAAVAQFATRASARFPTNPDFSLLLAQNQLKAGQLQQAVESAKRATQAAPKDPRGWQILLAAYAQMKQSDSIVATGKAAVAAGVPKDDIGTSLATVANEAFQKAQASKTREDYQAALDAAQQVDAIAPSPQSAFFIGVASFQVATDMATELQKLVKSTKKADKEQSCTEAKQMEDLLALTQINMPKGASVSKEAAGQIMGAVGQYGDFINGVKKAFCK